MKKFIFPFVILLMVSCGTTSVRHYSGPPMSNHEVAIFSLWVDSPYNVADFFPADLKVSSEAINGEVFRTNSQIEVLPGDYQFKVKCDYKGNIKFNTYEISAEEGKNYAIIVYAKKNECQFKKLNLLINNERFEEI